MLNKLSKLYQVSYFNQLYNYIIKSNFNQQNKDLDKYYKLTDSNNKK
jgi:hypothetical protein